MVIETLVVAAAITRPAAASTLSRQLLCAQRGYPRALRGKWELPGGKVEAHESCTQALRRELQEELQISVMLDAVLPNPRPCSEKLTWQGEELPQHELWPIFPGAYMKVFMARLATAAAFPQNPDLGHAVAPAAATQVIHEQVCWIDAESLNTLDWLPGDLPISAELQRLLI